MDRGYNRKEIGMSWTKFQRVKWYNRLKKYSKLYMNKYEQKVKRQVSTLKEEYEKQVSTLKEEYEEYQKKIM